MSVETRKEEEEKKAGRIKAENLDPDSHSGALPHDARIGGAKTIPPHLRPVKLNMPNWHSEYDTGATAHTTNELPSVCKHAMRTGVMPRLEGGEVLSHGKVSSDYG